MPDVSAIAAHLGLIHGDASKTLGMKIGSRAINPGDELRRTEAQTAPELSSSSLPPATYFALCLDLDAPFQSFNFMSPILHWVQPGLHLAAGETILRSSAPAMVWYAPPGPPPGAAVHRYVFLLYDQPPDFDAKKHAPPDGQTFSRMSRVRFDLAAFEKSVGLGEVKAVNYFVSN